MSGLSSLTTNGIIDAIKIAAGKDDFTDLFVDLLSDLVSGTFSPSSSTQTLDEILALSEEILNAISTLADEVKWVTIASNLTNHGTEITSLGNDLSDILHQITVGGASDHTKKEAKKLAKHTLKDDKTQTALLGIDDYMGSGSGLGPAYQVLAQYYVDQMKADTASQTLVTMNDALTTLSDQMSTLQFQGFMLWASAALHKGAQEQDIANIFGLLSTRLTAQQTTVTDNTPSFLYYAKLAETQTVPATMQNDATGNAVLTQHGSIPIEGLLTFAMMPELHGGKPNQIVNVDYSSDDKVFWLSMDQQDRACLFFADDADTVYLDAQDKTAKYSKSDTETQWRILPASTAPNTAYYVQNVKYGTYMYYYAPLTRVALASGPDASTGSFTFHAP